MIRILLLCCLSIHLILTVHGWSCFSIDKDSDSVCSGNGRCVASNQCVCTVGYTGDKCSRFVGRVASMGHTLFLRHDFRVLSFGNNFNGQLGHGDNEERSTPTLVDLPEFENITQVDVGERFSLALRRDGRIFSFGGGANDGEAGFGDMHSIQVPSAIPTLQDVHIVKISAGLYHSIVVSKDHEAYSWGRGQNGRLGLGNEENRNVPEKISIEVDIVDAAAGGQHSLLMAIDGTVYSMGQSQWGQVGLGQTMGANILNPTAIADFVAKQVFAGRLTSFAITEDNTYGWGRTSSGELCMEEVTVDGATSSPNSPAPINLQFLHVEPVQDHTFVLFPNGTLSVCGEDDEEGLMGLGGDSGPYSYPQQLFTNVAFVYGSQYSSFLVNDKGWLYAWGEDSSGHLGGIVSTVPERLLCEGWEDDCQVPVCFDAVQSNTTNSSVVICSDNGECVWPDECSCGDGHAGKECEILQCFEIDASDPGACSGNGKCVSANQCQCDDRFEGDQCEIQDTCLCDEVGSLYQNCTFGVCTCKEGFYGSKCQSQTEEFDDDGFRNAIAQASTATDLVPTLNSIFTQQQTCLSENCQAENDFLEHALEKLQTSISGGDQSLKLTQLVDFVSNVNASPFQLKKESETILVDILKKETCERTHNEPVKSKSQAYLDITTGLNVPRNDRVTLLRCFSTQFARNHQNEQMSAQTGGAAGGKNVMKISRGNVPIALNQFSIAPSSFDKTILGIELSDDEFDTILEITGIDDNGDVMDVNDLEDPIPFEVSTNGSQYVLDYTCMYFDEDEDEWKSEGLIADEKSGFLQNVTCKTTHLTMFRVEVNYGDEPTNDDEPDDDVVLEQSSSWKFEWWMGLLIAFATIGFVVVLISLVVATILTVMKMKKKPKGKSIDQESHELEEIVGATQL